MVTNTTEQGHFMIPLDPLIAAAQTDPVEARERLVVELYAQLRLIAASQLADERPNHTLQKTALANEAWLRLHASENMAAASRECFLAAAATAMRRILIDHARGRNAEKRGGSRIRVTLTGVADEAIEDADGGDEAEALNSALAQLERDYPRQHRVVLLKYLAGMEVSQIATALGVSERTVANDWTFARAKLAVLLSRP